MEKITLPEDIQLLGTAKLQKKLQNQKNEDSQTTVISRESKQNTRSNRRLIDTTTILLKKQFLEEVTKQFTQNLSVNYASVHQITQAFKITRTFLKKQTT